MSSIADLAKIVKIEAEDLLSEAKSIGVTKLSVNDPLTNEEKTLLIPLITDINKGKKIVQSKAKKTKTTEPDLKTSEPKPTKQKTKQFIKVDKSISPSSARPVKIVGSTNKFSRKDSAKKDSSFHKKGSSKPSETTTSEITKSESGTNLDNTKTKEAIASTSKTKPSNLSTPDRKKTKFNSREAFSPTKSTSSPTEKQIIREVTIPESITVKELSDRMAVKSAEVIKLLMGLGSMVTSNQLLDQDTAILLVEEMGHKPLPIKEDILEHELLSSIKKGGKKIPRAPIVTIMGHVDHGKTSLLDYIRSSHVAPSEQGGITQHIGAYHIKYKENNPITFIDTPGHEAFTAMRARGAEITDIVILIVAGDDGVKPQTIEAIQHAKNAKVPMVVAVTKMDKEDVNFDKTLQELAANEVIPDSWGGEVQVIKVSSKTGEGVDKLLESVLLEAEVLELKALSGGPATGTVIESKLDKGHGPIATVIVTGGTLKRSQIVICGFEFGKVRLLIDENNKQINSVKASMPVQIIGLSNPPIAGDEMVVVESEKIAKEIVAYRRTKNRDLTIAKQQKTKLSMLHSKMEDKDKTDISILIKADVQGSIEAISSALLDKLNSEEVSINVIATGVGAITESDINLALASEAVIVGFNVRTNSKANQIAAKEGVQLYYFSVIFNVIDTIKDLVEGKLSPEIKEKIIGIAKVREVFTAPKIGQIAGCIVTEGIVKKNNPIRVLRDSVVIYEGKLESLRRFKEDVNEVKNNTECGIGVKDYKDVKIDDLIEIFEHKQVKRTLNG